MCQNNYWGFIFDVKCISLLAVEFLLAQYKHITKSIFDIEHMYFPKEYFTLPRKHAYNNYALWNDLTARYYFLFMKHKCTKMAFYCTFHELTGTKIIF